MNYMFSVSSLRSAGGWRGFHLDRTNLFVNDIYRHHGPILSATRNIAVLTEKPWMVAGNSH